MLAIDIIWKMFLAARVFLYITKQYYYKYYILTTVTIHNNDCLKLEKCKHQTLLNSVLLLHMDVKVFAQWASKYLILDINKTYPQ